MLAATRLASILARALLAAAALAVVPAAAQNVANGQTIYNSICISCHGFPPVGGPETAANSPSTIAAAINNVPSMSFLRGVYSNQQLADLAAYIGTVVGGGGGGGGDTPALNYTSLWWNPNESGWGVNFNHQGSTLFATMFTYDAAGAPMWLVSTAAQSGESFSGSLLRTTGPAFNANPFTPIGAGNITTVGTFNVSFAGPIGTMTYSVNGVTVTKTIERQTFGSRAAICNLTTSSRSALTNYQDLWWNAAESGWGINLTHQDNTIFGSMFNYRASGQGVWWVATMTRQGDGSYLGSLLETTGPPFNPNPFTPIGAGNITTVGTMRLTFTSGTAGTLNYSVNGVSVTKAITRQEFGASFPSCS